MSHVINITIGSNIYFRKYCSVQTKKIFFTQIDAFAYVLTWPGAEPEFGRGSVEQLSPC